MHRFTQEDHVIINSRLDAIEEDNKRNFASLKQSIHNNYGLLRSLLGGQGRLNGKIGDLEKDVNLIHLRVVSLEHALDDLRADFDAFTPTVGPEIDDKLAPLQKQLKALNDQLTIMNSEVAVLGKGIFGDYQLTDLLGHTVGGVAAVTTNSLTSAFRLSDRLPATTVGDFSLSTGVGYTFVGTAPRPILQVEDFMRGTCRMNLTDTALMYGGSHIPLLQQSLLQLETTVPPGPTDWKKLPQMVKGVLWMSLVDYEGANVVPVVVMRKVNATVTTVILPDMVGKQKLNFLVSLDDKINVHESWNGVIIHGGDFVIII
uniref:Outer fiber attachment protein n=4 Tax=Piscine orthoreovirus TaxID=1157337 RepID=A0A411EVI2_9REOV|nr:outer fiber attachment protein [Piscine orthoreovirus]QCT85198.1 sigma 1 [Piscine orthoreovirus]QPZ89313.1 Sigma1 [Piscine orthoreovirus]QWL55112.1 sigma 1 [Piscine orthoreovirus]